MGLYLCIFDDEEIEIDGLEVGSYGDFGYFVDTVVRELESGKSGSRFPILTLHSDSDGEWSPDECVTLSANLREISKEFKKRSPAPFHSEWQLEVAKLLFIRCETLYDSFIDVDGEPLLERLLELCEKAIATKYPICFQ